MAVTVGKAPPLSLRPTRQKWAGCLHWYSLLCSAVQFAVQYKIVYSAVINPLQYTALSSAVYYLHCTVECSVDSGRVDSLHQVDIWMSVGGNHSHITLR